MTGSADEEVARLLRELAQLIMRPLDIVEGCIDDDIQALGNRICDLLPDCTPKMRQVAANGGLYPNRCKTRRIIITS